MDGRKGRRLERRMNGWLVGKKEGWMGGWKEGRKGGIMGGREENTFMAILTG